MRRWLHGEGVPLCEVLFLRMEELMLAEERIFPRGRSKDIQEASRNGRCVLCFNEWTGRWWRVLSAGRAGTRSGSEENRRRQSRLKKSDCVFAVNKLHEEG